MLRNMALLTLATLVSRVVSVGFNAYLSKKIGAGGIGLYSLIMNVGGFAVTFALSGINLAAMRLTAEAVGKGSDRAVIAAMRRCMIYSLCFGCAASFLLFIFSQTLANDVLCDPRTLRPLRIFCIGLPFISLSSAMNGYFTGVRRINKSAPVQIAEQLMTVTGCIYLIGLASGGTVENACCALVFGSCAAQALSFTASFILYLTDRNKYFGNAGTVPDSMTRKLLGISLPVAFSTYVRSGLLSIEHALIPSGLKRSGSSAETALASYGILVGMAMPVVLFPHAFLAAYGGLLIPELTACQSAGNIGRIEKIVNRVFRITLWFSIGAAAIMLCYSDSLGQMIFSQPRAGKFIGTMAPLAVVMYLDNVTDSILKGLGEQLYCMRVNIIDDFLCTVAVYFIVPVWGIYGYIAIIFASELLNAGLSIMRLAKLVRLRVSVKEWFVLPLVFAAGAGLIPRIICAAGGILIPAAVMMVISTGIYVTFVLFTKKYLGQSASLPLL